MQGLRVKSSKSKKNFAEQQKGGNQVLVNLKIALAARNKKQVELALDLKISPSLLSEIIHERRRADASLRTRIAEALITDEAWLFSCLACIPRAGRKSA